jgi:hypothetical protein
MTQIYFIEKVWFLVRLQLFEREKEFSPTFLVKYLILYFYIRAAAPGCLI